MSDDPLEQELERLRSRMAAMEQPQTQAEPPLPLAQAESLSNLPEILETVFHSMSDGVVVADQGGRLLHFNRAAEEMVGIGRTDAAPSEWSERYGCYLPDMITPYPAEQLPLAQAVRGEAVNEVEVFIRHATRPRGLWLSVNARPLLDAAGVPCGGVAVLRDITAHKQAMEALRANETRTLRILETAHDAFVAIDADGQITDWNRQAELTFGWPREEAIGRALAQTIIPPRHREAHQRGLQHFLATGQGPIINQRIEVSALHRSGREFPIELTVWPVRAGSTYRFNAFVHDITERKRAEEALAGERNRLQTLMDHLPDCVYVKDAHSRFIASNPAHRGVLGAGSLDEVRGKTDFDFFPYELAQAYRADEEDIVRTGRPFVNRLERAGVDKWVLTSKVPLRDGTGNVVGLVGISRDVTSLRQAEERLREAETLYHSLVQSLPLQVFRKDLEGRFTFANRLFCEALGLPLDKVLGRTDFDLCPRAQAEEYRRDDRQVIETGRGLEEVQVQSKPNGDTSYYQVVKVPVHDGHGAIIGTQGICWDVTTRRRAEEALLQAKEAAEAANRAKSQFLATVSHEIRTPMNAIINATELVLDSELAGRQRDYLNMVKSSAESLLGVINDILDFSKIEAGRMELVRVPFGLRDVLDRTMDTLALRARDKGLELVCRVAPGVPDRLAGDPGRLRQVLLNLLGNAIKFTEHGEVVLQVQRGTTDDTDNTDQNKEAEGGQAGAEAPSRHAAPEHSASSSSSVSSVVCLHFTVSDTGPGIAADKRELIFQPFSQADGSLTRKHGGTGLGLAITRRLLELMDGRVWLESEPGKGSTFHFTARFGLAAERPTERPPPSQLAAGAPLRILLTEDNPFNQKLAIGLLEKQGHTVVVAVNGKEALAALEREPFDLVLMDVQMPEMGGLEATAAIRRREQETGRHVPILAMTAYAMKGDRERCLESGMDGYVSKPVRAQELLAAVAALGSPPAGEAMERPAAAPAGKALDWVVALEYAGGDEGLLRELVKMFLDECPGWLADLRQGLDGGDRAQVKRLAHNLKASAAHFGARTAYEAALRLEVRAQQVDLAGTAEAGAVLESEIERLRSALGALPDAAVGYRLSAVSPAGRTDSAEADGL